MTPLVSICMPHLNSRPFTKARLESILSQTLSDWELLIVDSASDDGSRDDLEWLAQNDRRVRIFDAPRDGIYPNFNRGVGHASGKYIYIATSDDTMAVNCLEMLAGALETHSGCDLAHCALKMIDATGAATAGWWAHQSTFARSTGELLNSTHIRMAPLDGLLHLLGRNVYISITQLLIRRSLFDKIGYFDNRWGTAGDFHWEMRAGLVANTVHVPTTWAGWRIHDRQATVADELRSEKHFLKIEEMIGDALRVSEKWMNDRVRRPLHSSWAGRAHDIRNFNRNLDRLKGIWKRRRFVLRRLVGGSWAARSYLRARIKRRKTLPWSGPELIREWLEETGAEAVFVPRLGTDPRVQKSPNAVSAATFPCPE